MADYGIEVYREETDALTKKVLSRTWHVSSMRPSQANIDRSVPEH